MTEFIQDLEELKRLPPQIHLLCPRIDDDDDSRYDEDFNGDIDGDNPALEGSHKHDEARMKKITQARDRREKFMRSMQLFAYDGDDVQPYKEYIWQRLEDSLSRCEVCIRAYYFGKLALKKKLRNDYDEDEVNTFFEIFNERDIQRITKGLARAAEILQETPEKERGLAALDYPQTFAIFEALSCDAFLDDEGLLHKYLDETLRLVQTKRPLKIPDYVPAVMRFLFDPTPDRMSWAMRFWSRMNRPPSNAEFDWAIRDFLLKKLREASVLPFDPKSVDLLWCGLQLIVQKYRKVDSAEKPFKNQLLTHQLRSLDVDFCKLLLDHLSVQTPGLRYLLSTFRCVLEQSPADFWDAMGSIAPSQVIELVFASPYLDKYLVDASPKGNLNTSALEDMLSWITPFMSSLDKVARPRACATLMTQLLDRGKNNSFSNYSRNHCFLVGLEVLLATIVSFSDDESSRQSVTRVVLHEVLKTVNLYVGGLFDIPAYVDDSDVQAQVGTLTIAIIRNALALDCQCLKADFEVLSQNKPLEHGSSTYSKNIWEAVISHLNEDNLPLSEAALQAIQPLPGLDTFPPKDLRDGNKEKTHFNETFEQVCSMIGRTLERIVDFKPEHLDELYKSQTINMTLISALYFKDDNVRQAATDLLKGISGESGRKEAISHLLQAFFATAMHSVCWALRRISSLKTYGSVPYVMRNGMDILDVLADSQSGILRTRKLDKRDVDGVEKYWRYQWKALVTAFSETERWLNQGISKSVMTELCRDTMQFAEALFEQYDVFASAISTGQPEKAADIANKLLEEPASLMEVMVKWLRLKDEYLATTLVKLTTKMLRRLGQHQVKISAPTTQYIEGTIGSTSGKATVKTMLTAQQKAELASALENYSGKPLILPSTVPKKQSNLKTWTESAGVSTPSSMSRKSSDDEFGDSDIPDAEFYEMSKSVDLNKARPKVPVKAEPLRAKLPAIKPQAPRMSAQDAALFRQKREKDLEAKRKRDQEAIAKKRKEFGIAAVTAGQGSGVNGIGIKGKDHAPAATMMVSSESESDSEDELDKQIFGHGMKSGAGTDSGTRVVDGRKQILKQTGPVKKVKQIRSAKDMRARLAPDLSPLHKTLLGWDFFAEGDLPPSSDRVDYSLVSNTFRQPVDYQRTFEPLLILEGWQSLHTAREEGGFKPFQIKVANRVNVDSFVEISTSVSIAEGKDLGIGEADMILLSKSKSGITDASGPHCLARVSNVGRKKGNMEITYRTVSGNPLIVSLAPGVELWGFKILSLTPMEREYGALLALQYYDLCEEIIRARPSPILSYSEKSLEPLVANYEVNIAQAKAVKSALDNDAFTLIQGPPGSGKTKTIVALVGAVLTGSIGEQGTAITHPMVSKPKGGPTSRKLLVCAPSNAAVDELVIRFKRGVKTLNGTSHKISVVRLGRSDAINSKVKDVTLEELVSAKLNIAVPKDPSQRDIREIMAEHKEASEKLNETRAKLDQSKAKGQPVKREDEQEFDHWKRKKALLGQDIDKARESGNAAARDAELSRRRVQQEVLDGAHVICATLSGSGHEIFQHLNVEFETVIIDEAAQSIELSALIPLKYGCSKCILVGDPKQLPPTVLSREAAKFQYEQSLFVRMQENHPKDVHLLDTQYRMHPEISRFPSKAFYDSRLMDGNDMAKLRSRPWHRAPLLGPYRFFDVEGMHQSAAKGHSLINVAEARVALQLYERLIVDCQGHDFRGKIGIITPYKGQMKELKRAFSSKYGENILSTVEFNTTDAFQGRECDVIIFSCVRASARDGVGFLADIRRMNVGLTRAKCSLWVLGNSQSLRRGEYWRGLVEDARSRSLYTDGDVLTMLQRPQLTLEMLRPDIEMKDAASSVSSPNDSLGSPVGFPPAEPPSCDSAPASGRTNPLEQRPGSAASLVLSSTNTPVHTPPLPPRKGVDGPSGGRNGLNDLATCNLCGSYEHFTHKCDNIEAQKASVVGCHRCGERTHTANSCKAERCLECGEIGHVAKVCTSAKRLSKQEMERVAGQERRHVAKQNQSMERHRQRQLGEHASTIPIVRATTDPEKKAPANAPTGPKSMPPRSTEQGKSNGTPSGENKRKRPESATTEVPRGPKSMKPELQRSEDRPLKRADSPAAAALIDDSDLQGLDLAQGPDRNMPPISGRPMNGGKPPPGFIRKKPKADDMFIKPKRRPNP